MLFRSTSASFKILGKGFEIESIDPDDAPNLLGEFKDPDDDKIIVFDIDENGHLLYTKEGVNKFVVQTSNRLFVQETVYHYVKSLGKWFKNNAYTKLIPVISDTLWGTYEGSEFSSYNLTISRTSDQYPKADLTEINHLRSGDIEKYIGSVQLVSYSSGSELIGEMYYQHFTTPTKYTVTCEKEEDGSWKCIVRVHWSSVTIDEIQLTKVD